MKKPVLFLFAVMAMAMMGLGPAWADSPLRIGFSAEPYPPFTYKSPSGKWDGFEIDLADAICAEMDQKCKHVPTAWSGIIPALQTGKIDMIMNSMSITPAREKKISFTIPYYTSKIVYVGPEGSKIKPPEGLKGKTLGVQGGTVAATYAHQKLEPMGVRLRTYSKQEQLNRDLMAYRVDMMLADEVAMHVFVDQNKGFKLMGEPDREAQRVAIGVRKDDNDLRKQLNKAITGVLENGKCSELSEKYFNYDLCAKP